MSSFQLHFFKNSFQLFEVGRLFITNHIEAAHENEPRLAVPSCHGGT